MERYVRWSAMLGGAKGTCTHVCVRPWNEFHLDVIRDNQMSYQYEENEILLTDFRQVQELKKFVFSWQLAMITVYIIDLCNF